MANQLDNQPYTELSVPELIELERQISSLIGKNHDGDGQQKLQELIAERDFRRTHGTVSEKMYFIDNEMHDISMKLNAHFRFSNPSDRKRFYDLNNRYDELAKEKSALKEAQKKDVSSVKKDVSSVDTRNLNELQEELANATEALDNMRDFMPAQPTSEYLNQMQEAALRVEKLQKEIKSIKDDLPLQTQTNTSISKFSISPLPQPINGSVAVCSATFYNTLTVNGMTINNGRKGLYVKMPQKRTKQGRFLDVCHPLSAEGRQNINETLISAYLKGNFKQEFEVAYPQNIAAQNSVKYPPEYGNSLARMDLIVDDMVVHNARIIKRNGEPRLSMPSYQAKDGSYTTICVPSSKESYAELNSKALEEFNTEYTYSKFSDTDVDALKESGVKFQSRKNENGENIVKFKTADLQKVNAVVYQAPAAPKI